MNHLEKSDNTELNFKQDYRLKARDTNPHTKESLNNLINLYEAWNKPEKAKEWEAKLQQMGNTEEK